MHHFVQSTTAYIEIFTMDKFLQFSLVGLCIVPTRVEHVQDLDKGICGVQTVCLLASFPVQQATKKKELEGQLVGYLRMQGYWES